MTAERADYFWIVWCPESGTPTYKHTTLAEAQTEAKRLATKCPGRKFYILGTHSFVRTHEPVEIVACGVDEIPF